MEILTLLKANIRHKKSAFISVLLLMIIISMSLTAILSVRSSSVESVVNAYEQSGSGDVVAFIFGKQLTDELLQSVEAHESVDSVKKYQAVHVNKSTVKDKTGTNGWAALKLRPGLKLFNAGLNGYEEKIPPLSKGEIYVPQGILTNMECGIGDKMTLYTIGGEYEFTIKGVVVEPFAGSAVIGWKDIFISDEDFEEMCSEGKAAETDDAISELYELHIFKSDNCTLSIGQFKRQLNLDTGMIDNSHLSITRDASINYTTLYTTIISSCLMVFIGILTVIVLIVMGHSISSGIEMDYVNFGVLKAQGLSNGRLRAVLILQYLLAQIAGALIGTVCALPLAKALCNVFQPITAILAESHIAILQSLIIILGILIVSAAFVFLITNKVGKISPVRAISGGRKEIYFDSRVKAPIYKRGLSASLALRQFTSGKRRYAAVLAITAILVFFMMTVTVLGDTMNSKTAIEAMGEITANIEVSFHEVPDDTMLEEIEKTVEEYSPIEKKRYMDSEYVSINGEEMWCGIYKDVDNLAILKGRVPTYNNEIVITEIVADEMGIAMGDKVTLSYHDKKGEYIISGIYQYMNDVGRNFAMSLEAAEKLGIDTLSWGGYTISDESRTEEITDALNEKFAGRIEARYYDNPDDIYSVAIDAMKAVIYSFSVIFALVTVHMVCSKAFICERADIGIYKAMGFTSGNLRLQFALRFLIVSVLGSVIGAVFSVLFSGKLLSTLLRSVGITHLTANFTPATFMIPITMICICFFVFAYFVSRKIKNVAIRDLVVES